MAISTISWVSSQGEELSCCKNTYKPFCEHCILDMTITYLQDFMTKQLLSFYWYVPPINCTIIKQILYFFFFASPSVMLGNLYNLRGHQFPHFGVLL